MSKWRPEGWVKEYGDNSEYEDGADAILEALFKMAKQSPTGTFIIDSNVINIYEVK